MVDDCADTRKRARDDDSSEFDEDSHEPKISRVEPDSDLNSSESCYNSGADELGRVDSETTAASVESAGAREIEDDLLMEILDDSDNAAEAERDPTMHGLDSVIKSFEDEILAPGSDLLGSNPVHEPSDLQHLLEASDDELGLPPTVTPPAEDKSGSLTEGFSPVGPNGIDLSGFMGFEYDIPQYEAIGYGVGVFVEYGAEDNGDGFVTLDGLFDHADPGDGSWRSESLQAM